MKLSFALAWLCAHACTPTCLTTSAEAQVTVPASLQVPGAEAKASTVLPTLCTSYRHCPPLTYKAPSIPPKPPVVSSRSDHSSDMPYGIVNGIPYGVVNDFPLSEVPASWRVFTDFPYDHETTLADIIPPEGECIMWGAKSSDLATTFHIAAFGKRSVIAGFNGAIGPGGAGQIRDAALENGAYWYVEPTLSFGFTASNPVGLMQCDAYDVFVSGPTQSTRLCWHADIYGGGWRAGDVLWLNSDPTWRKVVMYGPCSWATSSTSTTTTTTSMTTTTTTSMTTTTSTTTTLCLGKKLILFAERIAMKCFEHPLECRVTYERCMARPLYCGYEGDALTKSEAEQVFTLVVKLAEDLSTSMQEPAVVGGTEEKFSVNADSEVSEQTFEKTNRAAAGVMTLVAVLVAAAAFMLALVLRRRMGEQAGHVPLEASLAAVTNDVESPAE